MKFFVFPLVVALSVFSIETTAATDEINFKVGADPRVELISTVEFISSWSNECAFMFNKLDFEYKKKILERFSTFKDHKAVQMLNDFLKIEDMVINAPLDIVLHLTDPPEMKQIAEVPEWIVELVGGEEKLQEFIEALRDFAVKTNYMEFYNSFSDLFEKIRNRSIGFLEGVTPAILEEYYGVKQNGYSIVTALLAGGFGPRVKREDGKLDCYAVIPATRIVEDEPIFGSPRGLQFYITHEFGHSFVNPVVASFSEEVKKYDALFEPIREKMKQQRYTSWQVSVYEHCVRAVEIRIIAKRESDENAEKWMNRQISMGYNYIEGIVDALKEHYEPNRDKYPTFKSFFPEILTRIFHTRGF